MRAAITMFELFRGWIGIAVVLLLVGSAHAAPSKPTNIVLMTIDNVGYGDLGCYGNTAIKTPNMDHLATQGVRCTDFYTASPTCTVSRGALLTGRYPQRNGLTEQLPGLKGNYGIGLRQSERIIPFYLKKQGYATACFGKWNIGFAEGSRPTERGFDEFLGHASGNIDYYTHVYQGKHDLFHGIEPYHVKGYSTDLFADATCEFMQKNVDKPFFIYLPFNAPHFPQPGNKAPGQPKIWQAPDEAFEAYGWSPSELDAKRRYFAVITALDTAIGRVLKQIDDLGIAENTLVILFSDNGTFMIKEKGLEVATNKPLSGGGITLWEGGIRVACMVRWPGKIEPKTVCSQPLLSCDFFTMALKTAGAPQPTDRTIDGIDPTAALAGEASLSSRDLYFQFRKYSALRSGRYKLLNVDHDKPWMLFDLETDIGEATDLRSSHPDLADALLKKFEQWTVDVVEN